MSDSTTSSQNPRSARNGFTLVELVITLSVSAIVAGLVSTFIARPMEGYVDLARRAVLVDTAETALRRIARDVHSALPNSLRIDASATAAELLHIADGGRYRRAPGTNPTGENHTASSDVLDFSGDTSFNVLGRFGHLAFTYGSPLPVLTRLAIYNTTLDAYSDASANANPGVITPSTTTVSIVDDTDEDQLQLSSAFDFEFESPRQRIFVVDTPITFLCDLGAGTLTRFADYSIASTQPTDPAMSPLSGASSALLAVNVSSCTFTYDPGTLTRAGLLTLDLSLTAGGETVTLLHQLHVENTP